MRKYWIAQKKWALKSDYHLYRLKKLEDKGGRMHSKSLQAYILQLFDKRFFSFAPKLEHVQVSKKKWKREDR